MSTSPGNACRASPPRRGVQHDPSYGDRHHGPSSTPSQPGRRSGSQALAGPSVPDHSSRPGATAGALAHGSSLESKLTIVMEPTRDAWVPLAAWFRRQGAHMLLVSAEQSADLRAYYAKHTKSDRLDSILLVRGTQRRSGQQDPTQVPRIRLRRPTHGRTGCPGPSRPTFLPALPRCLGRSRSREDPDRSQGHH